MSDLNDFNLDNTNSPMHTVVAPDPTATLESDTTPKQQVPHSSGFHNFIANIKAYGPKHYMARIISIVLIIHGIMNLYEQVYELFFVFPNIPEVYKALNFSEDIYKSLLYRSAIVTATGVINTIYGVALVVKHSHVVEYFHVIAGIVLFIASYFLLQQVPPLELEHLSQQGIALLLHF